MRLFTANVSNKQVKSKNYGNKPQRPSLKKIASIQSFTYIRKIGVLLWLHRG
jgi:hypothetical protein